MLVMKVKRLTVDPITNLPILILVDEAERVTLPIRIGAVEASAIASELANVELKRPQAHDLMKAILGECGARLARVELRDVRRETFYAAIVLDRETGAGRAKVEIDARPSDAIALALRTGAPIQVARKVLDKVRVDAALAAAADAETIACGDEPPAARRIELDEPTDSAEGDEPLGLPLLESLRDEDFPKWKM